MGLEVDVGRVDVDVNIKLPPMEPVAGVVGGEVTGGTRVGQLEATHHWTMRIRTRIRIGLFDY